MPNGFSCNGKDGKDGKDLRVDARDVPWNVVGEEGQPPFKNGWANYGKGYASASFKEVNGIVYIRGMAKNTANKNTGVCFTLPPLYRPSDRLILGGHRTKYGCRIDILTTGDVSFVSGSSKSWTPINLTYAL